MKTCITHFEHKGSERKECQDVFFMSHQKKGTILCLADGVSGSRFGKDGAFRIEQELSSHLTDLFDEENPTEEWLKERVCGIIRKTMAELVKRRGCSPKEFASTLLLVLIPESGEEVWLAHLGDGMILNVDPGDSVHILSYPHYGVLKQYTYTTASPELFRFLHVRRKKISGWAMAMTDGVADEIMEENHTLKPEYDIIMKKKDFVELEEKLIKKELFDDIGFFAVRIGKKEEGSGEGE